MKGLIFVLVLVGMVFLALGGFVNGTLPQVVELQPTGEWHTDINKPGPLFAELAHAIGLYK